MNPLDSLLRLGGTFGRNTGGSLGINPLIQSSTFLTTQLRKAGLIPKTGIKEAYGGELLNATAARPKGTRAILNGKPVFWTGDQYGWQSPETAAKAGLLDTGSVPGAPPAPVLPPPSGSSPPAERAYQRAKTQTAAQVAADPLLQKWEAARQAKDYATADQLGQQIWQNKYGATPMGQPGGAVGSFNPLMQSTFGYQAGMSPREISQTITNPSPAPVAPGEAPLQMGDLGTRAMAETGYDPTAYGVTPEQIEAIKAKLLQQAKK